MTYQEAVRAFHAAHAAYLAASRTEDASTLDAYGRMVEAELVTIRILREGQAT